MTPTLYPTHTALSAIAILCATHLLCVRTSGRSLAMSYSNPIFTKVNP